MGDNEQAKETISAVVDDGFLGDDDEGYEFLYNDVNFGENILQSLNLTDNVADQEPESQPALPPLTEVTPAEDQRPFVNVPRLSDPLREVQKPEIRSDDMAPLSPNAMRTGGNTVNVVNNGGYNRQEVYGGIGGGRMLFVGELQWWTTDADLESELWKYGPVKEVKIYDEKPRGKSKGYAHVEFFYPAAATACKENMNGHVFNGRPCVVAFASSPSSIKTMGKAKVNSTQSAVRAEKAGNLGPATRDGTINIINTNSRLMGNKVAPGRGGYKGGGNFNKNNNNNRGYGNWGRGIGQGMGGGYGRIRNRPMMGNGFGVMLPPQAMMEQGFNPTVGGPIGGYGGGFPRGGPSPPFSGMMSSFPPVGVGVVPGVARHDQNPAFFGRRGMGMKGMGMGMIMGSAERGNMGMWSDSNMGW